MGDFGGVRFAGPALPPRTSLAGGAIVNTLSAYVRYRVQDCEWQRMWLVSLDLEPPIFSVGLIRLWLFHLRFTHGTGLTCIGKPEGRFCQAWPDRLCSMRIASQTLRVKLSQTLFLDWTEWPVEGLCPSLKGFHKSWRAPGGEDEM